MTSPTAADEDLLVLFSALDDARFLVELGQFDTAKFRLDEAQQVAGEHIPNRLLVATARLCLLVQLGEHANAVTLIDECLEQCADLPVASENNTLRADLLVQRGLSLCQLQRWKEALDTFRRPEIPQDSAKAQAQILRCLRALQQNRSAQGYLGGSRYAEPVVPRRDPTPALSRL